MVAQTVSEMVDDILAKPDGTRFMLLAPVVRERKGEHIALLESLQAQGFTKVRIDGVVYDMDELPTLAKRTNTP